VKPFFIMGNKRSGTTLLTTLLNCHPKLWVGTEKDIIWILYQCQVGDCWRFAPYEWDTPYSMWQTLHENFGKIANIRRAGDRREAIVDAFYSLAKESQLEWAGDKKPVQHADPAIHSFIRTHFPDARFLHIVRHPRACVGSMMRVVQSYAIGPRFYYWPSERIFARWAIHEDWVLEARSRGSPIHSLRYEDLCADPIGEMKKVFKFLDVESNQELYDRLEAKVGPNANPQHEELPVPPQLRLQRIMRQYGY
jgi:hypothetical protein